MVAPCKNCKDRFIDIDKNVTCHASCEKYLEYDAQNKARYEVKKFEIMVSEYTVKVVNKNRKNRAKKSRLNYF